MVKAKTATVTFRIDSGLKDALKTAADRDHRSITNLVEVLIRDHCRRKGIAIQEPAAKSGDSEGSRG
jgi:hypothetical protein